LIASTRITPENPGQANLPARSQATAERSIQGQRNGGMKSAGVQVVGKNILSCKSRESWLRLNGRPCPKGVVSERAQMPRRFGATMISLPLGVNTLHTSRKSTGSASADSTPWTMMMRSIDALQSGSEMSLTRLTRVAPSDGQRTTPCAAGIKPAHKVASSLNN